MARVKIAAGNWKMNTDIDSGMELARGVCEHTYNDGELAILGVPATHLKAVNDFVTNQNPKVKTAAQTCHHKPSGAYTGDISAEMIKAIGVDYVIVGHSERRDYYEETDEMIAMKIDLCLENNLQVIFCCGEQLDTRKSGHQNAFVTNQVKEALFHLNAEQIKKIVIAYEPVWAIGTGETATPEQAQEMHKTIRDFMANKYGDSTADELSILYGGSVKAGNAQELFSQPDVDGGLVGGASLEIDSFITISKALT